MKAARADLARITCGRCPHNPPCDSTDDCVRRFARQQRNRRTSPTPGGASRAA
jgi:hypothetical protein